MIYERPYILKPNQCCFRYFLILLNYLIRRKEGTNCPEGKCERERERVSRVTSRVDFINFLRTAFKQADPECAKKDSQVSNVIWCFWDLRVEKLHIKRW